MILKEPEFKQEEVFKTIIWRTDYDTVHVTQETTQEKLLQLLIKYPTITRNKLSELLGISKDGVKYHLDKLKKDGVIKHVGATKKGHCGNGKLNSSCYGKQKSPGNKHYKKCKDQILAKFLEGVQLKYGQGK